MTLEDELRLSYYKELAPLNADHGVFLVMDTRDNRVCVKKKAHIFNLQVFSYLKANPVKGMPGIYELIEEEGSLITIEEYIPGVTLDRYIKENGCFSEEKARAYTGQLCRIVRELHSVKPAIIHRDIKPENIIITNDGILKLLDLNAAKRAGTGQGKDTVLIGTAGYAAPEQYGFAASDEKTDIYAIGAVLNYMLTGKLPGQEKAAGKSGEIVDKCTRMEPDLRYKSVFEVMADLQGEKSAPSGYAPPGFRSEKPFVIIFSAIGYIALIRVCLSLDVESVNNASLWLTRILVLAASLFAVFLAGNYRNIKEKLGFFRIKNKFARAVCEILLCFFVFAFVILIDVIFEDIIS